MSEHNEESWGEMAALSRRIINLEQRMLERILALEAEVAALKGQGQGERGVYQDAREIEWREDGAAQVAIDEIMQR
jgi:hypothetical protein